MKKETKREEIYEAKLEDKKTAKDRLKGFKKKGLISKVLNKFK